MQDVATATFVGRKAELSSIARFLERVPGGPYALVIEGEAGIGKTTVWVEAARVAEESGLRMLKARPAESEANLSYAALSDLVGIAFDEVRGVLPAVQERALASVLLRAEPAADAPSRTTATALVGVLTLLADQEPVLLAVDDVQWLDPATQQVLTFALRRLPQRLGVLLARRATPGSELPLGLAQALPEERIERIVPGPLSLAALHQLVKARLGLSLPRPLLNQLATSSGGNPFFALEMARAYASRSRQQDIGEPLPVPRTVEDLVAAHVDHLSDTARQVALAAAATSYPTTSLLEEALSAEADVSAALIEAEEAGVLVTERERIQFAHPLLASVIYGSASNERRRQLHKRLAVVVSDPEQRARHLALSTTEPEESIASEIEQAAVQAAKRGAQHAAAELFAASARLTPVDLPEELTRRRLGEASGLLASGEVQRALELAEESTAAPTAALRAEAHYLVGEILWVAGTFQGATQHLQEALETAPGDQALAARVYPKLAYFNVAHDPARAVELADAGMQVLDPERAPGALASVVISRMWAGLLLGEEYRPELLERWRELEERAGAEAPKSVLPLIHFHSIDDFEAHGPAPRWKTSGTACVAKTTGVRSGRPTVRMRSFVLESGTWQKNSSRRAAKPSRRSTNRDRGRWPFGSARSSTPAEGGSSGRARRCCR